MLVDISISTEAMVVISGIVVALAGVITFLFTTLKNYWDKHLASMEADRNSWKNIAEELGINLEKAVNRKRAAEGLPPFKPLAPVVPEHSSPVTAQQQETADIGTMRARLVAAVEELSGEPWQPPPAGSTEAEVSEALADAKGAIDVAKVAVVNANQVFESKNMLDEKRNKEQEGQEND